MEAVEFRDVSFSYAGSDRETLKHINLKIHPSEFTVLCGKSGCGKSTLLRQLKKNLIPYGQKEGQVLYYGTDIQELEDRESVKKIGFVQQNPDNQIVTDKVWHELAFGLESLGYDNASMKRKVAEMASFFGIQTWFHKNISELSGGQKQLVNLASIMVMKPKILILDEPTSQLDPIAASDFIQTLYKINRELGTAILISEHRLEELFPLADRAIVMEDGEILIHDTPQQVAQFLAQEHEHRDMFYGLPSTAKIYSMVGGTGKCPLSVREGRLWMEANLDMDAVDQIRREAIKDENVTKTSGKISKSKEPKTNEEPRLFREVLKSREAKTDQASGTQQAIAIRMKDVHYRYHRGEREVLQGVNLEIPQGEWICILGGNGVGKSTTLKALSGIVEPQSGFAEINGIRVEKKNYKKLFDHCLSMLPQNPQAVFTEITMEEDLLEALYPFTMSESQRKEKVDMMLDQMELTELRTSHPYDLSGGEQQRLALGKILLQEPKVLLLDEPTKGLDPFFKRKLGRILTDLRDQGVTIFMVSHDIEFCADYADRCALFFDGEIVALDHPVKFFAGNRFYTTVANRVAGEWFPEAVTCEEVARLCKEAFH